MKKLGIGEIASKTGWPALLREIQRTGDPVVITRGNGPVAVLMPCNESVVRYLEDAMALFKVLNLLAKEHELAVRQYLGHQIAIGFIAKIALSNVVGADLVAKLEAELASRITPAGEYRTEDRATVGTDPSAVPVEGKGRRRKPSASPKQSPPRKR